MSLIPPGDLTLEEIRAVRLDVSEPTLLLANFECRWNIKTSRLTPRYGLMDGSSEDVSHLLLVTLRNGVIIGRWNYLLGTYLGT